MFVDIKKGRRRIRVDANKVGFLRKGIGLMFRTKNTKSLIFEFSQGSFGNFTSLFVFFPFVLVWMDKSMNVISVDKVSPFRLNIFPKKRYHYVLEVPINEKNRKIVDFFVGKRKV